MSEHEHEHEQEHGSGSVDVPAISLFSRWPLLFSLYSDSTVESMSTRRYSIKYTLIPLLFSCIIKSDHNPTTSPGATPQPSAHTASALAARSGSDSETPTVYLRAWCVKRTKLMYGDTTVAGYVSRLVVQIFHQSHCEVLVSTAAG